MSKYIKITQEEKTKFMSELEKILDVGKFPDGKINISKDIGTIDRKATIYFTENAWHKMQTLIREFSTEVGWHGIATRGENPDTDEYYVTDILVYPQEVSGTTVTPDQVKYQTWLMQHDDDVFNNIRMQGHSHVNMGTTPSAVDLTFYESILAQLDNTMFYIFMIWNKSGSKTVKLYDLAKNVLFETLDVTIKVIDDENGLNKFLAEAKDKVQTKTPTYGANSTYPRTYGGYNAPTTPVKPASTTPSYTAPAALAKKDEDKDKPQTTTKKGGSRNRKGKRDKGKKSSKVVPYSYDDYDDYDDESEMDYYERLYQRQHRY